MEPYLSNMRNNRDVPQAVSQDLVRHAHDLKNKLFVMIGKVKGKTFLPLPAGLEKLEQVPHEGDKRWLPNKLEF